MRTIVTIFCCILLAATSVHAAETGAAMNTQSDLLLPAMPHTVVMNRQNAHVFATTTLPIVITKGRKLVVLPLPKQAVDVQVSLPKIKGNSQGELISWTTEWAMPFAPQGSLEKQRVTYESMHDSLQGALATLEAEEAALIKNIENAITNSSAEGEKTLEQLRPRLALVGTKISSAKREIAYAAQRIKALRDNYPQSKQLVLHVDTTRNQGQTLTIDYTFVLADAYWNPEYAINVDTKNNTINVSLKANIVQNSDLDWENVRLELSTAEGNAQSPQALRPWIVSKAGAAHPYARMEMADAAPMMLAKSANGMSSKSERPYFDDSSTIAHFVVEKASKIAEGNTILNLAEYTWKSPLMRIARPAQDQSTVWISAKHTLDGSFLPIGEAVFMLDGVTVGKDILKAKGNELTMYFGADPLISVVTQKDTRQSDEKGIINKEQSYNFAWTYTVVNQRNEEVLVRIEEPITELADAAMKVVYADTPKAQEGPNKSFYWNVEVPAKGEAKVTRKVTVTAPANMTIWPGR